VLRLALFLERSDATHVDQSVVGASCVSVLRDLSARGPVLLAVDEVRSLDPPTAVVLVLAWRDARPGRRSVARGTEPGQAVSAALDRG
jgi:hypothetical protein